jgi:hypothetical protein
MRPEGHFTPTNVNNAPSTTFTDVGCCCRRSRPAAGWRRYIPNQPTIRPNPAVLVTAIVWFETTVPIHALLAVSDGGREWAFGTRRARMTITLASL